MTEPTQTNEPQPTEFALRSLEEVRLFREKIAQPVARVWGVFVADLKQGWDDIREGMKPKAKVAAEPKTKEVKAKKVKPARLRNVSKRTLVKIAAGNFRYTWKDAFNGMKLRYFLIPNSKKIDPKRMSWTQAKSITSILGGAAIGGAAGFMAYVIPYVFMSAVYTGVPLLALGVGIRAVGVLIPKGDLKNAVKNIGKKTFATGVVCAMWPMVAVGAVAFGSIHAVLTTGETLAKGFGASLRAAYLTMRGRDNGAPVVEPVAALPAPAADNTAKPFAETAPAAGADFAQAAADAPAQTTQTPAASAAAKPARKPR